MEDEHWFTSVEGSTEGPEMIHRLGTLRDIIETIDDSTNMKISPKLERKLWKIIARGPEANNLTPYLEKILA